MNNSKHNNPPLGDRGYDYIITGSGCAGLSLLLRLLHDPTLSNKKILVIDKTPKTDNDRTWCFWEKKSGLFEEIIHHEWEALDFFSADFSAQLDIAPYRYKMIRGIDFYNYVISYAKAFANVEFKQETVQKITTENNIGIVETEIGTYTAVYIFNSILFNKPAIKKKEFYLLQHFKGWLIETKEPSFKPTVATFMDFKVSQEHGTTFMYVMPTSTTQALVEYTLFTENLLQPQEYETALQKYIASYLNISNYTIIHQEFGIIPMTNHKFKRHEGMVVNIGIAGGQAKGSSGYAFQFIQKRIKSIVQCLVKNNHPYVACSFADKKFNLYDSVLLHVLQHKKLSGDKIFAAIFKKNKAETVLKFLDNESNLLDDLKIMNSVPTGIFLPAAMREMFK